MITAVAWRLRDGNHSSFKYRLQTNGANFKSKNKLLEAMKGWHQTGTILHTRDNTHDFLFCRTFSNASRFVAWAKTFPYCLNELSSTSDRMTRVKTACGSAPTPATKAQKHKRSGKVGKVRVCGQCGQPGHNARTCTGKTDKSGKVSKISNYRRCGQCREFGHNTRSCPELQEKAGKVRKIKKVRICRKCEKPGHNARTCKK